MIFEAVKTIGALFTAYGIVSLLSGRLAGWKAYGFLAVGEFFLGLLGTADGSYGSAVMGAGLAALFGHRWWQGGGQRQVQRLRQQLARKGGA